MPFSRMRNNVVKLMTAYVTNCVAPHASDTRSSTGCAKNARHVDQNAASEPAAFFSSMPPRTGSRTNDHTSSAAMTPTAPSDRNAERQSYAAAIDAPNAMPRAWPMGGPKLKNPRAVPRMPGGK